MKKFIFSFLIIVLSFTLFACQKQPEESLFEGEKRSYTERINGDGSIHRRWYYKYYPDGEISTSISCLEDGTCIQRNEYTYTEDKLMKSETIYLLGVKKSYTEYDYNEEGKVSLEKIYLPDDMTVTTYYYNSDGTENYVEKQNAAGDTVSIKRCFYDENGNLSKEQFFDGYENNTGEIEYTYEQDKLTVKEYIGSTSDEFSKEEYFYDGENVVKTFFYDKNGNRAYTDTAEYEEDRCMHRMRVDANNSIVYTWNAYYDSFLTLIG